MVAADRAQLADKPISQSDGITVGCVGRQTLIDGAGREGRLELAAKSRNERADLPVTRW
jgi:hypothetical protein